MSTITILAIESSCDETAVSVVQNINGCLHILSNEISSQVKLHAKWGGVVPNLAAREHLKNISPLFDLALKNAGVTRSDIDAIAVTQGPGLIPALLVGTTFAKNLAYLWEKPLIGIHHIEGHIYANFISDEMSVITKSQTSNSKTRSQKLEARSSLAFPALALVVSGGHTQLIYMSDHLHYKIIGQTMDDAVGEAFDKVARILNIGYPGGPAISALAKQKAQIKKLAFSRAAISSQTELQSIIKNITFPRPMLHKNGYNFSFSGLKTAVLYETRKNEAYLKEKAYISAVCREFQQAAIDVLVRKTIAAAADFKPKTIMLAGGVSANEELRVQLQKAVQDNLPAVSCKLPAVSLTGDNAAMIGAAAAIRWQKMSDAQKKKAMNGWKTLQPDANLKLR